MTDLRPYLMSLPGTDHNGCHTLTDPVNIEVTWHSNNEKRDVTEVFKVAEVWPKCCLPGKPFWAIKSWRAL